MHQPSRLVAPPLLLALTLTGHVLSGQSQPQSGRGSSDSDVVEMTAFVVDTESDVGYTATSTLAGSRLNTELKDIAAPISVFTKEFLDDIGATSVNAALEYGLNTVTEYDVTGNGIIENNFQTRMRGIAGAGRARNFMTTALNADVYNTERLDFSRGPNSVLFGIGSPAGIINTSTKFARLGRDFTTVQARWGSYDSYRASLDINRMLGKKIAIRGNFLWQDQDGYRDFEFQKKKGAALSGTWRPFRNTTIRAEGEFIDVVENRARPWTPFEAYIGWENNGKLGANTATTWGGTVAGTAVAVQPAIVLMSDGLWADQFVWNNATQNFKWSNGASANIPGLNTPPNVLDFSRVRREANIFGAGARSNSEAKIGGIYLEQKVSEDLSFELAAATEYEDRFTVSPLNFGNYRIRYDTNAYLPVFNSNGVQTGMQANPNFGRGVMISNGGFGNNSHLSSLHYRTELRATVAYQLDFRKLLNSKQGLARILGHHRLAALVSDGMAERTNRNMRYVNIHPSRTVANYFDNQNRIFWGSYFDPMEKNAGMTDPFPALEAAGTRPLANGSGASVQPSLETAAWNWNRNETLTKMFAMQSFFWDGRVVGLLGWRSDEQDIYNSSPVAEASTTAVRGFIRNGKLRTVSGDTFTRGVVVHVLPDFLSVYYNRANNFQDNGVAEVFGPTGNLTSIGNRSGEGQDAGIKLRLFNGKLNASLGWYETSDTNQNVAIDGNFAPWMEGIWAALGTPIDLGGRDTRDLRSKGYEFELTANPTRQITLTFNAKDAETTVNRVLPWTGRYIEENRAAWLAQSGAIVSAAGLPVGTTVGETVQRIDELVAVSRAVDGNAPFGDRRRMANFYGRYTFAQNNWLKGLTLGMGAQYRGPSLIAYRSQTDGGAVHSPSYTMASGMASYNWRLRQGMRLRLQLNVDNLFNLLEAQPVAGGEPTGATRQTFEDRGLLYNGVVYTVYLPPPRSYSLTATLSF